jgi:hypothetical protein
MVAERRLSLATPASARLPGWQSCSGSPGYIRLLLGALRLGCGGRPKVGGLVTLLRGGSTRGGNLMHRFSRDGLELPAAACLEAAASYLGLRRRRVMLPERVPMRIQNN